MEICLFLGSVVGVGMVGKGRVVEELTGFQPIIAVLSM